MMTANPQLRRKGATPAITIPFFELFAEDVVDGPYRHTALSRISGKTWENHFTLTVRYEDVKLRSPEYAMLLMEAREWSVLSASRALRMAVSS